MQGRVGTFLSQIRRAPLKFRSRGTATKPRQSVHTVVVVEECVVDGSTYMGILILKAVVLHTHTPLKCTHVSYVPIFCNYFADIARLQFVDDKFCECFNCTKWLAPNKEGLRLPASRGREDL